MEISDDESVLPDRYILFSNYPNPFNPETTFKYNLPVGSNVGLEIFNLHGQIMETLVDEFKPAGTHQTRWLAQDGNSNSVPSGVYVIMFKANDFRRTMKILLLK